MKALVISLLLLVATATSQLLREGAQFHGPDIKPEAEVKITGRQSKVLSEHATNQIDLQTSNRHRELFFEGANTLGPLALAGEVLSRVFIFILEYFIAGPLFYYWDIFVFGGYNWYPLLNKCLTGPPPFDQCLRDEGLK